MSTSVETAIDIRPFHVEIPEEQLAELRRRIAATRWPSKELVDDRSQGVQSAALQALARYWATEYDWRKAEAKLNALPQFTTEIDGVEIHFIHVKSEHENALPLIMTHGWPGSVVELLDSVGPLTDPTAHGGSAEDAFHLVLPSLPGYGLSGEPVEVGWDLGRTARAWAELMRRLGYTRYVAQGGDVGAGVTDAMGRQAPEGLVGIHTNLLVPALGGPMPTDTDEERAAAAQIATFGQSGNGYFVEMATRPQTIGYALLDSPVALAAWMIDHDTDAYYKIARAFVDGQPSGNLTRDHILDNITLYWLTGTGASAARSYWEAYGPDAPAAGAQPLPPPTIPFGFTTFPGEIWRTPRSWVEASYPNVIYFNEVDKGGHFAAWEEPELFATEIRAAFRSLRNGGELVMSSTPTVVLVHGAFADGSSWSRVIERLQAKGVPVTAPANPLRGISSDSAYIASVLDQIAGPVLAVGHSYGGAVITNAATDGEERRRPGLRRGVRPRRGRDPRCSRGGLEGQRPEQRARPPAVSDRGRGVGDGVLHRPGQGPRRVRRRPLRRAGRADRSHPAARRRSGVRRAERAARVEAPPVMGGRRHRRQGGRHRRRPLDGRAGRREDHRGRGLARDHDLAAPGRDRRDPGGAGRGRRRVGAARRLGVGAVDRCPRRPRP